MGWPWVLQRGRPGARGQSSLSRGAMQGHVRHAVAESHTAPRAAWRPQGPRGWGPGVGYHAGTVSPQPPTQGADSPGPACLSPGPAPSTPSGTTAWTSPLYPRLGAALWESAPLPHPQDSPLEPHSLAWLPRSSSEGVGLPGVGVSTERKPGGARTRPAQNPTSQSVGGPLCLGQPNFYPPWASLSTLAPAGRRRQTSGLTSPTGGGVGHLGLAAS